MIETKALRLLHFNLVKRTPKREHERLIRFKVKRHMPFNKFDREVYFNTRTNRWSCSPCFWMDNYGPAQMKYCSHIRACELYREKGHGS